MNNNSYYPCKTGDFLELVEESLQVPQDDVNVQIDTGSEFAE